MWFDDDGDLLPGLLPGLFRGVKFFVPDTSIAAGRRVAESLFPGVDLPGYDDFGLYPADIAIEGVMIGADYIAQAIALEAAFQVPGPATLVHPWRGPMTVMLREPGNISFSSRELRVARFSVSFVRYGASTGLGSVSTLVGLMSAATALTVAASALAASVDRRVMSTVKLKASDRSGRVVRTAIGGMTAPVGARRFLPRLTASLPSVTVDPAAFDAMMISVSGRIAERFPTPAVAPAARAVASDSADAASLVAIGLGLGSTLATQIADAPSTSDAALLIAAGSHVAAATASQAVMVTYDSRDAALAYRAQAGELLAGLVLSIENLQAGLMEAEASVLRRALRQLRSAIISDVNETVGRLPAVQILEPGRPVDAFLVAHHLAGDTPAAVEAVYADIVARNRPRHPAYLDGARIEVKL